MNREESDLSLAVQTAAFIGIVMLAVIVVPLLFAPAVDAASMTIPPAAVSATPTPTPVLTPPPTDAGATQTVVPVGAGVWLTFVVVALYGAFLTLRRLAR